MGDQGYVSHKNLDAAKEELDELIDVLEFDIENKNWDNDSVIWIIEAWMKINIKSGVDRSWGYWQFKRVPAPISKNDRWSKLFRTALVHYSNVLGRDPGSESGDYFYRADDAFLNFVWTYRQAIAQDVDKETDFVHQVQRLLNSGRNGVLTSEVFRSDQSL